MPIHLPNDDNSAGIPGCTITLVQSGELRWIYLHITETKNLGHNVFSPIYLWTKIIRMVSRGNEE